MKILLVTQFYYPERFSTTDIAEELVKAGNEVTVLTGKPNYGYGYILKEYKHIKNEIINGVKIIRCNLCPRKQSRLSIIRNYLSFFMSAKRRVGRIKENFDIVLSISLSPVISIAPAIKYAKKHQVPHVLFCQDLWPESTVVTNAVRFNSLTYKILYKWSRKLYTKCDEIIISSPSFKDYFQSVLKINDKKFPVVYQPIIRSKGSEGSVEYEKQFNFVYAGNIGTLQLSNELIDAFKLLDHSNKKLFFMGMGTNLAQIQNRIKEENLGEFVEYVGALPIEKAERYYKNADALIVSLKNVGTVGKTIPNKAIQYMTYGRPLIGVIEGDGKELLEKAKGTVFANENPKIIANCIENFCSLDKNIREKMGQNNKEYFDKNLSSEILTNHLLNVLKESRK